MRVGRDQNIVNYSAKQLDDVLISNRNMTENSLRIRAMAYLSQIKATLLTETICELNEDKKAFISYTKILEEKNSFIQKQNKKLQKLVDIKKENEFIKYQTKEVEKLNAKLNIASKVAKIGFWDIDVKSDQLNWSEGTYDIFDIEDRGQVHEVAFFFKFLTSEWAEKVAREFNASIEEKREYFIVHEIETEKGNIKYVEERAKHYYNDIGEHIASIGSVLDITQLMVVQDKLEKEQKKFHEMFIKHDSMMFLIDPETGHILDVNEKTVEFYGYNYDEFLSMKISEINTLAPSEVKKRRLEAKEKKLNRFEFPHRLKNGEIRIVEVNASPIETSDGIVLFSVVRDITEKKHYQEKLEKKQQELKIVNEQLLDSNKKIEKLLNLQDNIVMVSNGVSISFANQKFFDFLGYRNLEEFKKNHNCIGELFVENDRFFHLGKINKTENWIKEIRKLPHNERIVSILSTDRCSHAFSVSVKEFEKDEVIISFTDISQTIEEYIKLEEKAVNDQLTGVFNREFFEQNIEKIMVEYNRDNNFLAIGLLDIDYFKSVNDIFGHDIGDHFLIHFVEVVQKNTRDDDLFIRWGGDEFILILKVKSHNNLQKILEYIRKSIETEDFPTVGQKTCSIGGAIHKDGEDIHTTIKRADKAVYNAKDHGRNLVVIK